MNKEYVISDEILEGVVNALANNYTWLAYNTLPYFHDKDDVKLFKTEKEADEWAFENNCKTEAYRTIYINSIADLYNQSNTGSNLNHYLIDQKIIL